MGILNKLFKHKTKKFDGFYSQTYMIAPNLSTADYLRTYSEVGWLFACSSKIAQNVADSEWNAVKKDKNGEDTIVPSRITELLLHPNPFTSFYDFFELNQMYLELTGKSFWYVAKDRLGRPQEIYLINPLNMIIYPDPENFIKGYGYRAGCEEIPLSVDEVIFFSFPNPMNPYDGTAPAKAAADSIESHKYATKYNKNYFYNGAEPRGIVTFPEVEDDDYEALVEKWNDKYGGVDNSNKTAFVRGSQTTYTAIQISQKDMDFFNLKIQSRDEILGAFGVPKSIIGITEDVNRANAETAEYTMAKHVVKPRLRKIQEKLNNEFVPMFKEEEGVALKFVDPVPENKEFISDTLNKALVNKGVTINEYRKGLNKLLGTKYEDTAGGDVIYQPVGLQPIGTPMPLPGGKETVPEDIPSEDTKPEDTAKEFIETFDILFENRIKKYEAAQVRIKKKEKIIKLKAKFNNLDREAYWKAFVQKTDKFEKDLGDIWQEILRRQRDIIVKNLKSSKNIKAINFDDILEFLQSKTEQKYISDKIIPELEKLMRDKANQILDELEEKPNFELHDPKVTEWLDKYCGTQIQEINSYTETMIREQIKQGELNGESIPELSDRIIQYFDDAEQYRITRISRTETISASNNAAMMGMKESGVVEKKEWLAALDERTREWHAEADGQVTEIDGAFVVDGEDLDCPGDPSGSPENTINCRCTVLPNFNDE